MDSISLHSFTQVEIINVCAQWNGFKLHLFNAPFKSLFILQQDLQHQYLCELLCNDIPAMCQCYITRTYIAHIDVSGAMRIRNSPNKFFVSLVPCMHEYPFSSDTFGIPYACCIKTMQIWLLSVEHGTKPTILTFSFEKFLCQKSAQQIGSDKQLNWSSNVSTDWLKMHFVQCSKIREWNARNFRAKMFYALIQRDHH